MKGVSSEDVSRVYKKSDKDLQQRPGGSQRGHSLSGAGKAEDLDQSHGTHVNTLRGQQELTQLSQLRHVKVFTLKSASYQYEVVTVIY